MLPLATGYALGSGGLNAVTDRENATPGAGGAYSTRSDMARFLAALLGGGANEHGSVLEPETLALMFEPHYQPEPRLPGMGLGFFRDEIGGHRTVGHRGVRNGFRTAMLLAPEERIGVLAFADTGWFDPRGAPVPVTNALLRHLLGVADDVVRADVPEHPEVWSDLCGFYSFGPGVLTDPQPRMTLGAGVEVAVRGERLMVRGQMPIPVVRRGLRLYPEADDPYAFRIDHSALKLGTSPVVFGRGPAGEVRALHLNLVPMSLHKRPRLGIRGRGSLARSSPGATGIALRGRPKHAERGSRHFPAATSAFPELVRSRSASCSNEHDRGGAAVHTAAWLTRG